MLTYNFTLVDLTAALSTGVHVATMSSLAQLRVRDTKEQRQGRHDARLTERGNTRSKRLLMMPRATKWLKMIAKGEYWNGSECSKDAVGINYRICFQFANIHQKLVATSNDKW